MLPNCEARLSIVGPKFIAPDSSHWAKWLDSIMSRDKARRAEAEGFHARLVESGRIPLLSWHHLEELLGVEHDQTAQYRVDFLQSLPLIAWMRLPHQAEGLGSIVEVLAAEAIAAAEGCPDFLSIRDRARQLLLRTGPGRSAIGSESWVWGVVRPCLRSRHPERDLVAALSPVKLFNDTCTIGELARASIITPDNLRARFHQIHAKILQEATNSVGGDVYRGKIMADEFIAQVVDMFPSRTLSIREFLVSILIRQGVDYDEIRDDCRLSDLSVRPRGYRVI